ncbi:MAG: hypothetical protein H7332_06490 [Bdellovibrionales bacterium]|nr:hypothetical protein [Ramlibacter sp.]
MQVVDFIGEFPAQKVIDLSHSPTGAGCRPLTTQFFTKLSTTSVVMLPHRYGLGAPASILAKSDRQVGHNRTAVPPYFS